MYIICFDNDGVYLTVGRIYSALSFGGDYVTVINDVGMMSEYNFNRHFMFKEE